MKSATYLVGNGGGDALLDWSSASVDRAAPQARRSKL